MGAFGYAAQSGLYFSADRIDASLLALCYTCTRVW